MTKIRVPERDLKKIAWKGNIPLTSRYTAGVAGEKFFKAMKEEGKLLGTRCEKCKQIYVPARLFCERCFSELADWLEVEDYGNVYSFTVVHTDMEGRKTQPPQIVALIELGKSGARMVHLIGEVEAKNLKSGMPVKAVWKPREEREGKITDIQYFKLSV